MVYAIDWPYHLNNPDVALAWGVDPHAIAPRHHGEHLEVEPTTPADEPIHYRVLPVQFLPALSKSPNETYYSPFQSPFGDETECKADVLAPAVLPEDSGSLN